MKNLISDKIPNFIGRLYFNNPTLYGRVENTLKEWLKIQTILEQVNDDILHAYFTQRKGEITNALLCEGVKQNYPDYPEFTDSDKE